MAPRSFRALLREPGCLVVPAVYDAPSARLAECVGFRAVGLGGFLVAASRLSGPDVGQLTMTFALVGLSEYQRFERRYATDGESAMETKTP